LHAYDTKAVELIGALRASHPNAVDAVPPDLVNGEDAIRPDAENFVSTLYAADEQWFADVRSRRIILHRTRILFHHRKG